MYDAAIFGTKRAVRNWKVEGSPFKERFDLSKQFLPSKFPDWKVSDKTAMLLTYNCLLSILVTFSNYRLSIHLNYILTRTNASCFHEQIGHSPSWLLWISKVVHSTLPAFDRTVSSNKLPEQLKQLTCILMVITFLWDYKPENSILNGIYILGRYGGLTNQ